MAKSCKLPEELVEEIMSWLPPESLERFKCVAKSWRSLINGLVENPAFVAKHLCSMEKKMSSSPTLYSRSLIVVTSPEAKEGGQKRKTYLLTVATDAYCRSCEYIHCDPEAFKHLPRSMNGWSRLVSHCDGIVCLCASGLDVLLVNPALKELKVISTAPLGRDVRNQLGVGFGYDARANEYKVVVWEPPEAPSEVYTLKARVFTLSTNSWKEVKQEVGSSWVLSSDHQTVYCNGVCYWYSSAFWHEIASFDLADEVFCGISLPPEHWLTPIIATNSLLEWSKIAAWNDSLVFFLYADGAPTNVDVWVMNGCPLGGAQGSCFWSKHRTIRLPVGVSCPLTFSGSDVLIYLTDDHQIASYNLHSQKLYYISSGLELFGTDRLVICTPSLVSVLKSKERILEVREVAPCV